MYKIIFKEDSDFHLMPSDIMRFSIYGSLDREFFDFKRFALENIEPLRDLN